MKIPPKKGHQHEDPESAHKVAKAQFHKAGRHDRLVPQTTHNRKQAGGKR